MINTNIDTVVNRIRKLMALVTERGASKAEAALAAEHVQRLLAEHNLSMSSVEASGASSGDDGKRVREEGVGSRQVYKLQRELMTAVAELNYCKAFARMKSRGWNKASTFDGYDLIGRASNVATVKAMFEYLLQAIERLARDDVQDPTRYFTRYAHSFKEGCSDRLIERLKDKQEQIIAEQEKKAKEETVRRQHPGAASSNLPAVVLRDVVQTENDLNEDMRCGLQPGTTAANREQYKRNREAMNVDDLPERQPRTNSFWTDERLALLRKLRNDGLSAARIAAQIPGSTRNSVLSARFRFGDAVGSREFPRATGPRKLTPVEQKAARSTGFNKDRPASLPVWGDRPTKFDQNIPVEQRRQLWELETNQCRWPVGDPRDSKSFFFCGGEALEKKPYCAHHTKRAWA